MVERIGKVAYRLKLPPQSRLLLVFHISQLKKRIGDAQPIIPALPVVGLDGQVLVAPEAVLKRKVLLRNGQHVIQGTD